MSKIIVGVTGTGSLIGQAIIKSLMLSDLKDRVTIIGMDYFEGTMGSYWSDRHYLLPDILKPEVTREEWLGQLAAILRKEQVAYLFVGVDFELPVLSENKARLLQETGCTVLVSDPEVIRIADDKYRTYQFLVKNGIPAPKSVLWGQHDESAIGFPCIVKPRVGQRSRGVSIVRSPQELQAAAAGIRKPLIQELIGDPTCEYTCGAICLDGEVKAIISLRRHLKEGNTSEAFYDGPRPEIDAYVRLVAERLRPLGACNFQLRTDSNGSPKLFEINARHSGTTYMRALFGFNEVDYILKRLTGETPGSLQLKTGLVKRFYDETFIARSPA